MKHGFLIIFLLIAVPSFADEHPVSKRSNRCKYYLSHPLLSPIGRFYFKMKTFYLTHVVTEPPIALARARTLYDQAVKRVAVDSIQKKLYDSALRRQTEILLEINSQFGGGSVKKEITEATPPQLAQGIMAYHFSEFVLEGRALEWDYVRNSITREQWAVLEAERDYINYVANLNEAQLNSLWYENFRELQNVKGEYERAEKLEQERLKLSMENADQKTKEQEIELVQRFENWRASMMNSPITRSYYEQEYNRVLEILKQETVDNPVVSKIFHLP